ncbi:MAG: hypothetical protein ACQESW_12900, partial [Bacteroidota bacterium]
TLACAVIQHFQHAKIGGLKIAAYPTDTLYKHHPEVERDKGYLLVDEPVPSDANDSSRMLAAGAEKAFFLACPSYEVQMHVRKIIEQFPALLWVVESNTLAMLSPEIPFILLHNKEKPVKTSALPLLKREPVIFPSLDEALTKFQHVVTATKNGWHLDLSGV